MTQKSGRPIPGGWVNENFTAGHAIRDRQPFGDPKQTEKTTLVIVGGGIAGLSAAWRLHKRGFHDFVLLEMNDAAGGNARSGENEVSAYPWAAHYLPVPGLRAVYVRELFEDLGVLKNGVWDERHLCFAPQERLFALGRWQDGIEPVGLAQGDRDQFARLEDLFAKHRASGAFTIPSELGLTEKSADLDRLSFAQWLDQNGVNSAPIRWYMDYCCRDDYGALAADTSAWAGIHYFSSREPVERGPLTWPEGNGWITKQLLKIVGGYVRTSQPVRRIRTEKNKYTVQTADTAYLCDAVIFAAPTFLAPYIIEGFGPKPSFEYSPWLTANLTLDRSPRGANQDERAWDNVVMHSPTLGYVDATHQTLRSHVEKTVWTFYWALAEGAAADNRRKLLASDADYWKDAILRDLERVHPDIRACVTRIDLMRMGHAMARPTPGAIFDPQRRELAKLRGRLLFANSDLSGFSIFEEAQYRGVKAAEAVLAVLGRV
ncbi:FAD dependent oxidoreductase [Candidatus Koribacter versatilis Ellin345]|uniref:FAD dependent oxidoreductase n=2 Tax=Candidatus Korobacter versatilis TaxID=658062 RepID=Q1IVI3_KORVE|nr:FAD dependent oxidoreductase [Candidatus Koribacter versatilis Ellin345]